MDARSELDKPYLSMLEDVTFQPVFIMGDHRSGTTILYKVLGASGCFNIVTAYHIINYRQLLYNHVHGRVDAAKEELRQLFQTRDVKDRVFDRMVVDPDLPEEYGFLFSTGFRQQLSPENLATLVELCKKIQVTSDPTKPLMLKNPWDYFLNFTYVKQVFPTSKFVFIHRNPLDVVSSQLHAIRSSLEEKNEYVALIGEWYRELFRKPIKRQMARAMFGRRFNMGLRMVTRHVHRATDYYLAHVADLPQGDVMSVRYEDLCAAPNQTIHSILEWLQVDDGGAVDYDAMIQARNAPRQAEVDAHARQIYQRMKPYFESFGYDAI